jgi:hypothetical protein
VRILILLLLLTLIGVGVFLLLSSSSDDEDSLDFGPKIDGGNFVRYDPKERTSVFPVTKAIEEYLKRRK